MTHHSSKGDVVVTLTISVYNGWCKSEESPAPSILMANARWGRRTLSDILKFARHTCKQTRSRMCFAAFESIDAQSSNDV